MILNFDRRIECLGQTPPGELCNICLAYCSSSMSRIQPLSYWEAKLYNDNEEVYFWAALDKWDYTVHDEKCGRVKHQKTTDDTMVGK